MLAAATAALMLIAIPVLLFVSQHENSPRARIAELEKKAEQGSAKSQVELGKLYLYGDGVEQDFYLARNWFEKAVNQNYPEAHYLLAQLHFDGKAGFSNSDTEGITSLKKAASQDHVPALSDLGQIYFKGSRDVRADWKLAQQYLEQASKLGSDNAKAQLAALVDMQQQELREALKMTTSQLASHIKLTDVGYEDTYHTYTTPTHVFTVHDKGFSQSFTQGGEKHTELQGMIVHGAMSSTFKHIQVRVRLRISFKTDKFGKTWADKGNPYAAEFYPSKSFSETISDVMLQPGDRVHFQRYFDTKIKGEFRGLVLNVMKVVPKRAAYVDPKTLNVAIDEISVITP